MDSIGRLGRPRVWKLVLVGGLLGLASRVDASLTRQAADGGIVLRGTVVTMDAERSVLHNGGVFVRGGTIVATWQGSQAPPEAASAIEVDLGPKGLIFPGLIDLHDHPAYDVLPTWQTPSSHAQPQQGRPLGTEPYANRYQWNSMMGQASPELLRLVGTPRTLLTNPAGLGLGPQVVKYAEVRAVLGGETAIQGDSDPIADRTLIRNVEAENFSGPGRIDNRVQPIGSLADAERTQLLGRMMSGDLDAWLIHLAEGVRDAERRPGDSISSRAEFAALRAKGLLTEQTVILHGVGLEPEDFAAMRTAPSIRLDGSGDGLGAKLVWSPLSNLLLYGRTATVYQALAAGVLVSLGTDWSPSGSRNLLDELKVADVALRDPRVLGADRDAVPELAITGKGADAREEAERALDQTLVEMVTTNPARTLHWTPYVGSVEPGKRADLLVITRPRAHSSEDMPDSPYRSLIDATEEDVRLVLVNGDPLAGDVDVMRTLKPGDYEVVTSVAGGFEKAIDVTDPSVPQGTQSFASISAQLRDALAAMGGDHPPLGGGPAPLTNTYRYLKARIPGASALTDAQFTLALASQFGVTRDGRLNMEGIQLSPVLAADDDFFFHLIGGDVDASGLIDDDSPPYKRYLANFNQIGTLGNPFAGPLFHDRYFEPGEKDISMGGAAPVAGLRARAPMLIATPNPARSQVRFALAASKPESGSVDIYDVAGRRVATIPETNLGGVPSEWVWDLEDAAGVKANPGIYLARWTTAGAHATTRLVVLP